jgi:hypothetical protein
MKKYFHNGELVGYRVAGPSGNGVDLIMVMNGSSFSKVGVVYNEIYFKSVMHRLTFKIETERYNYNDTGDPVYRSDDNMYMVYDGAEVVTVYSEKELVVDGLHMMNSDEYEALLAIENNRNHAILHVKSKIATVKELSKRRLKL